PQVATAQAYPDKPIRVIVPNGPGGGTDLVGRLVGAKMSEALGVPLVFTNEGGAEGVIGTDKIAKSPPDGYNIGVASSSHPSLPFLFSTFKLDPVRDFTPICLFGRTPILAMVSGSSQARTAKEFIAQVRSNPGKFNYAVHSAQVALDFGSMAKLGNLGIVAVPYRSSPQAFNAMLANEVHLMATGIQSAVPYLKSGQMRAIAVSSGEKFPGLDLIEGLPLLSDEIPGFRGSTGWWGLIGPPGMPEAIVKKLSDACGVAVRTEQVLERFKTMYVVPASGGVAEMRDRITLDYENTRRQVEQTGMKPR
ncbi:MAG: tripartite tricarboxylate transporter substrate binding protein, partial [Devosia sp.]|nr:tripartite tricarboxylate transporter substrate binding protein [Devosia sp.]